MQHIAVNMQKRTSLFTLTVYDILFPHNAMPAQHMLWPGSDCLLTMLSTTDKYTLSLSKHTVAQNNGDKNVRAGNNFLKSSSINGISSTPHLPTKIN